MKIGIRPGGGLSPAVLRLILETNARYSGPLNSGPSINLNGIIDLNDVVAPSPLNQITDAPCDAPRVSRGKGARKSRKKKRGW
jgi:hypothetical protein